MQRRARPWLLHVIEQLIVAGQRDNAIVERGLNQTAMRWLGDGTRWGCRFEFLECPARSPISVVRKLAGESGADSLLIGHASTWLPLNDSLIQSEERDSFISYSSGNAEGSRRHGWTVVPRTWLEDFPLDDWSELGDSVHQLAAWQGNDRRVAIALEGSSRRTLLRA